jgi:CDP-glycerol glycerophosphotransferase (TagB/SpsB family)
VLDDYFFPLYVVQPRRGTTVIQAWHACGAFKRFGYSVVDKTFGADARLLRRVRIHRNYDVCLVSALAIAPHYAEAFDQPLSVFRADLGIPRTDVLFGPERIERVVAALRHRYAIPAGKRVVLLAPTFRGASVGSARADGLPDWHALQAALADDHVLLVRLHPFVREALVIDRTLDGFLTDVSDHPDINELLHVADVLVTDYSSVIFEYALLGRPMVFFAPDLEAYEQERGFYFDYRRGVPGPVVGTTAELAAAIRDPGPDVAAVHAFATRSFDVADGGATTRVIRELVRPALDG